MKQITLHLLLLIAITSAVFFTNLGQSRLWDRDEPRNAGCAAEMLARGDWVVPTFNDELRHQKPVLLYWLIMSAYSLFGQSEFSARFWSALLATGTVLATYGIASRLTKPIVGLVAGIILSTSLMFDVAARAATPDSVLIFCGSLALWLYVMGTFAPKKPDESIQLRVPSAWFPQNYLIVAALYSMLGLGVLAKGPVGFLLPMAMIGWFMLIQRLPKSQQRSKHPLVRGITTFIAPFHPVHFAKTLWAMRPLTATVIVLAIASPWYFLVDARTEGDFTRLFFLGEHFGRATSAMENHGGGLWFYPVAILVGFFPWSVFWWPVVLEVIAGRRNRGRLEPLEVLALCMIGVQVGVFSIAQTKLPSYVTPCYPALAMLTAYCLVNLAEKRSVIAKKWYFIAFASLVFGGVLAATGLGIAAHLFFPDQTWLLAIGLIPVLGGAVAIWQLRKLQHERTLVAMVTTSVLFCIFLFGFGTVAIDSVQQSQRILQPIADAPAEQLVATYRSLESSWVYYGGKPIYECSLAENREPSRTLKRKHWWAPKPRLVPADLVKLNPEALFITTDEHVDELKKQLPGDYEIAQTATYFLKEKQLVLLRRSADRFADRSGPTDRK